MITWYNPDLDRFPAVLQVASWRRSCSVHGAVRCGDILILSCGVTRAQCAWHVCTYLHVQEYVTHAAADVALMRSDTRYLAPSSLLLLLRLLRSFPSSRPGLFSSLTSSVSLVSFRGHSFWGALHLPFRWTEGPLLLWSGRHWLVMQLYPVCSYYHPLHPPSWAIMCDVLCLNMCDVLCLNMCDVLCLNNCVVYFVLICVMYCVLICVMYCV